MTHRPSRVALLLSAALGLPAAAAPADLPLRAITLYASGVGHHRHAGPVPAGAEVTLSLNPEELNDALKSLTVSGTGGAAGVSVSYPGRAGVDERLAAFGVDVRGVDSRFALLERLRGVPVEVTLGGGDRQTGRVLAVEERESGVDDAVGARRVLTLVGDGGVADVDLEKVVGLRLLDERLSGELGAALELLAGQRDTRRKPLVVRFAEAADDARISYLAAAPLWKLSYRLDLSAGEPRLQGWAIVDNTSDRDWDGVEVTLVSGRPTSFVQDLYSPEVLSRPVVRPERFAGLVPPVYDQGMAAKRDAAEEVQAGGFGAETRVRRPRSAAPAVFGDSQDAPPDGGGSSELSPAAEAADLGELFAYTLSEPVRLARGASAMLPILDDAVEAGRVSVYNAAVLMEHPMRGVRLRNTTGLKLDAGPVTVLDGEGGNAAYAGDARLGFTAPGDDRLLTYAIDLEVTAAADERTRTVRTGASFIKPGMLKLQDREETRWTFTFRNAAERDRDLLVEVPKLSHHELVDPPPGTETTADLHRLPLVVPAGAEAGLEALQTVVTQEYIALIGLGVPRLEELARGGEIGPEVKDKLAEAARLRGLVEEAEREVVVLDAERDRIGEEQARIRENLRPLERDSELRQRYVKLLGQQEDRLAKIRVEREAAEAQADTRRRAFKEFVLGL